MQSTVNTNDTLSRLRDEIDRTGVTQVMVAKEAGVSPATLTQILNGTYNADPVKQLKKLDVWLDSQEERRVAPVLPTTPWVETPTAQRISIALKYAQHYGDMVMIYGAAGLGKTVTCKNHQQQNGNVRYATMTPATSTVAACLDEICVALGIKEPPSSALRMQREILRRMTGTRGLLIIDEAQHLSTAALDAVRSLHDSAEVGCALVGNEALFNSMVGGNQAARLDRLSSRVGRKVRLTRAKPEDVVALAVAMGISPNDKKSLSLLVDVGNKSGALRSVVKTLRLAVMFAAGAQPAHSHIKAAWRDLNA